MKNPGTLQVCDLWGRPPIPFLEDTQLGSSNYPIMPNELIRASKMLTFPYFL